MKTPALKKVATNHRTLYCLWCYEGWDQLSKPEIELIREIAQKWCQHNTESLVDFTHEQLPWKISRYNEVIPYELITQEEPENVY